MRKGAENGLTNKGRPELAVLARQGFRFKKELGQNFLFSPFLLGKIAQEAGADPGATIVEIGAGAGSLTAALAARGAKVVALELDRALLPFLKDRFRDSGHVTIVQADVLKTDLDVLAGGPYRICANLPYSISTAFVQAAFLKWKEHEGGAMVLQKEVADKVTARPGQNRYGLLSLADAWYG